MLTMAIPDVEISINAVLIKETVDLADGQLGLWALADPAFLLILNFSF